MCVCARIGFCSAFKCLIFSFSDFLGKDIARISNVKNAHAIKEQQQLIGAGGGYVLPNKIQAIYEKEKGKRG